MEDDGYTVETRPWRTLVHVLEIKDFCREMIVELPGWVHDWPISVSTGGIPRKVMDRLRNGDRLHAYVNIGCEDIDGLVFTRWELAEPHEELNHRSEKESP